MKVVWLVFLCAVSYFIPNTYVYAFPHNNKSILILFIVLLYVQWLSAKKSKYTPNSKVEFLSICIVSPAAEVVLFQGIVLPLFMQFHYLSKMLVREYNFQFNLAMVLSAILFAIIHVMPRQISLIKFTIRIFILGIGYGILTVTSGSIIYALVLHIAYNIISSHYGKRNV